ncbi:HAD superfamily hydrolase (TIGR01549 family) [Saccharothrix coeruleofusca]|uniref:HAD family hydrolase n=1 Tax=Saccharothrix coeruleofusca TaxID=33919 RepID=UPI001AE263A5|nr:HAD-IA family hydrolase [Saccharothrix coeruleofusca]MBP2340170.1 HAD superfamily hydrolase (TIGR01549 family) [Saccharothrix coeruleofusca]
MTEDAVPVDDVEVTRRLFADADTLLLDFDGPICSVFAHLPAHHIAQQLKNVLIDDGRVELPPEIAKTDDPFDVLRHAATLGRREAEFVESTLRAHEVEAATTAIPTAGTKQLMEEWHRAGRKIGIVSNNSTQAISVFTAFHGYAHIHVSARTFSDPTLLKPSPHLVVNALEVLEASPATTLLIGDSTTDQEAARAAGVGFIGYANKPSKIAAFSAVSTLIVLTDLRSATGLI